MTIKWKQYQNSTSLFTNNITLIKIEILVSLSYINISKYLYLCAYLLFHFRLILSETSLTSLANLLPSSLHELMNVLACMLVYVCLHHDCYYYEFPVSTAPWSSQQLLIRFEFICCWMNKFHILVVKNLLNLRT